MTRSPWSLCRLVSLISSRIEHVPVVTVRPVVFHLTAMSALNHVAIQIFAIRFHVRLKIETNLSLYLMRECFVRSVSWPLNSKWYRKSSASRTTSSTPRPAPVTTETITTPASKLSGQRPQAYVVNEIVDDGKDLFDSGEAQEPSRLSRLQLNASDPASFGINWERVPYDTDFSIPVASISKLLVLLMPILLVLIF